MIQITNPRKFYTVIGLVLLLVLWVVFRLVWGSGRVERTGEFTIAQGQTAGEVWELLNTEGFTSRTLPWKVYGRRGDRASRLQAGTYQLTVGEKISDVVNRFAGGDAVRDELTVTFPEGFTLAQVAQRTAAHDIGDPGSFVAAAQPSRFVETFPFLQGIPPGRSLEGYLFPDTYRVFADDRPEDVIQRMLTAFDTKFTPDLRSEVAQSGRTLDQIVIMASIIEREVMSDDDMALVSGILWKRFDDGVGLDADATVRYALDKWEEPLTLQDLAVDSPYNTRVYRGLPPGPISNPGLRALMAALRPEESEYYYYLSAPDGKTVFSKTNKEHNVNKAKYLR